MLLRLDDIVRNGNRHLPEYGTFLQRARCSGDVYKRQALGNANIFFMFSAVGVSPVGYV